MKYPFRSGDQKFYRLSVTAEMTAQFEGREVHPVYSTFALARDVEWACRLFVLDMREDHEEGIGQSLEIQHLAPALVGSELLVVATLEEIKEHRILCSFEVYHGSRLLAKGTQTQKILLREKLSNLFSNLAKELS